MWSVVIVDDDPVVLSGMKMAIPWDKLQLRLAGEASDGMEGLDVVRRVWPDIVLTDVSMPHLNGLEMIEQLREDGFDGNFIILSGYSDFEYARQALRLQVDDYLSKPITLKTLSGVLQRTIESLEEQRRIHADLHGLREWVNQFQPLAAHEWMKATLTGIHPAEGWQRIEAIRRLQDKWEEQRHIAIAIVLEEGDWQQRWTISDLSLAQFTVGNIVQESVERSGEEYHYMELRERLFAIVLHAGADADAERWHVRGQQLASAIEGYLRETMKLPALVRCGPAVLGVSAIAQSWERACASLGPAANHVMPQAAPTLAPGAGDASGQPTADADDNLKHKMAVDYVVRYVHEHYGEELTLAAIAEQVGLSPNYLGQIFRQLMGMTFIRYMTCVRMEKAKQLVLEGKLYIYEIADRVGYHNIAYFTAQFKKYHGVSPSGFIKPIRI